MNTILFTGAKVGRNIKRLKIKGLKFAKSKKIIKKNMLLGIFSGAYLAKTL